MKTVAGSSLLQRPARHDGLCAIYCPPLNSMIMFGGGARGAVTDQTWALRLTGTPAWQELAPTGVLPLGRQQHTAVYDPFRNRMVVFGGNDGSSALGDVWTLSLSGSPVWSRLSPSGTPPSARAGHCAVFDPVRDRMVIFGGRSDTSFLDDAWALSFSGTPAWTRLAPAGAAPSARDGQSAIYDGARDRMLIFGGEDGATSLGDLWELSFAGAPIWRSLAPAGMSPGARSGHSAVFNPAGNTMLLYGGTSGGSVLNDTWALSLAGPMQWNRASPTGTPPGGQYLHCAVFDPRREQMVIFGGNSGSRPLNETWALSIKGTGTRAPAWQQWVPAGGTIPGRYASAAVYDPVRERMLIFGGTENAGPTNQTWALSLRTATLTELATAGTPPSPRDFHSAIYDPLRDRMVIFGGECVEGGEWYVRNDTWVLSLSGTPTWSQSGARGSPASGAHGPCRHL